MSTIEGKALGFNTGRLYQSDGQRISFALCKEGENERQREGVLFNDHARGIDGRLKIDTGTFEWFKQYLSEPLKLTEVDRRCLAREVMHYYDKGQYEYDSRADKVNAGCWPKFLL